MGMRMSVEKPRTVRPLKMPAAPATTKTTHLLRLVSAHKGKQKGQVTEEAMDDMELQKGRRKASCVRHGVHEPSDIGTHHQLDSESLGHGDRIPQWVSNGATAAIGHRHQRKHPVATKNPKHPCCEAQPRKEMAFFLTKKSESILGLMTKEKHMSTTDND